MIRTRDLFLFVVIVLFLLVGILATTSFGGDPSSQPQVSFDTTEAEIGVANGPSGEEINRSAIIDRLKAAVESDESLWSYQSSTDTPRVVVDETPAVAPTSTTAVQYCADYNPDLTPVINWPGNSAMAVDGGVRKVGYQTVEVVTVGTSTATTTVPTVLVQLPLQPTPVSAPGCVASPIIGVTAAGGPIVNTDAATYQTAPTNELLGYALDGHPIYGVYTGAVDACGGYQHQTGYRYVVQPLATDIVRCYQGVVQPLSI